MEIDNIHIGEQDFDIFLNLQKKDKIAFVFDTVSYGIDAAMSKLQIFTEEDMNFENKELTEREQAIMVEYEGLRKERFEAILKDIEIKDRIYFLKLDLDTISKCIGGKKGSNYTFLASATDPPEPFQSGELDEYRKNVKKLIEAKLSATHCEVK